MTARPTRRGTTVVELCLALAVGVLVLGIALMVLTTTARLGRHTDEVADEVSQAAALFSAVAADVRAADPATVTVAGDEDDPGAPTLTFERSSDHGLEAVAYRTEGDLVVRETSSGGVRRYPLGPGGTWSLTHLPRSSPSGLGAVLVVLEAERRSPPGGRTVILEAAAPLAAGGSRAGAWNPLL